MSDVHLIIKQPLTHLDKVLFSIFNSSAMFSVAGGEKIPVKRVKKIKPH